MKNRNRFKYAYILMLGFILTIMYSSVSYAATSADDFEHEWSGTTVTINSYKGGDSTIDIGEAFPEATAIIISSWAFYCNDTLMEVRFPKTLTSIGSWTFSECSNLQTVTFAPETEHLVLGELAFSNCNNLLKLELPEGVVSIPDFLCNMCSSLQSVTIPEGCMFIGEYAFGGCESLRSVRIPSSCTAIGNNAFEGCSMMSSLVFDVADDSGQTFTLGASSFADCSALTTIGLPVGCTNIPEYAFKGCSRLKMITIPDTCTFIGECAFSECSMLNQMNSSAKNELILPAFCESIGESAFSGCSSIKNVVIPEACETLGSNAFGLCDALDMVTFQNPDTTIGDNAFWQSDDSSDFVICCTGNGKVQEYATKNELNCTVLVEPEELSETNTIIDLEDMVYTGAQLKPKVTVTYNSITLAEGQDYEVTYGPNVEVGEGYVEIAGIGNYKGSIKKAFNILPVTNSGGDTEESGNTGTGGGSEESGDTGDDGNTEMGDNTEENDNNGGDTIINNNNTTNNDITNNTTTNNITNNNTVINNNNTVINNNTSDKTEKEPVKGKTYTVKGMKYKVTSSTAVTFMKPVSKNIKKCTIPSTVEIMGRVFKVTKINKKACYGYKKLTTVTIGDNVTTIGVQSFAQCTKLKTVTIGKGLKTIDKKAFYKDKKLRKMTIRSKKLNKVGKDAMKGVKLKTLILANGASKKLESKYKRLLKKAQ